MKIILKRLWFVVCFYMPLVAAGYAFYKSGGYYMVVMDRLGDVGPDALIIPLYWAVLAVFFAVLYVAQCIICAKQGEEDATGGCDGADTLSQ